MRVKLGASESDRDRSSASGGRFPAASARSVEDGLRPGQSRGSRGQGLSDRSLVVSRASRQQADLRMRRRSLFARRVSGRFRSRARDRRSDSEASEARGLAGARKARGVGRRGRIARGMKKGVGRRGVGIGLLRRFARSVGKGKARRLERGGQGLHSARGRGRGDRDLLLAQSRVGSRGRASRVGLRSRAGQAAAQIEVVRARAADRTVARNGASGWWLRSIGPARASKRTTADPSTPVAVLRSLRWDEKGRTFLLRAQGTQTA